MTESTDSHYDVLGISPDVSDEEIKQAYREKVKQHHPDHSDDPNAQEKLIRVRKAKETLLDPSSRKRYDQQRASRSTSEESTEANTTQKQQNRRRRRNRRNEQNRRRRRNRRQNQRDPRNRRNRRDRRNRQNQRDRQNQRGQQNEQNRRSRRNRQSQYHTETEHTQSRRRTGRQTETRSRDRTDSRDRWSHTGQGSWVWEMVGRVRRALSWPTQSEQGIQTQFRSRQTVQALLFDVATAPTVIRLASALALAFVVMRATQAIGTVTPAAELSVLLAALVVSYVGYAFVSPLPFESPRTRERFKPAGRMTLWPLILLHVSGVGFFGLTAALGANSGVVYAGGAVVYVTSMTVVCSAFIGLLRAMGRRRIRWLFARPSFETVMQYSKYDLSRGIYWGVRLGPALAALVLFTSFGKGASLRSFMRSNTGSAGPWVSEISVGSIHLGSVFNFFIATVAFVSVFGGVVGMVWALTRVPWHDRYDHGYSIRPGGWNLSVAIPTVCFVWMLISGVGTVTVSAVGYTIWLTQGTVAGTLFFLPTPLLGLYLLRRRIEPTLRNRR